MALSDKVLNLLNRSPGDYAKEQIRKLYLRLYPYIIGDFYHKDDLRTTFLSIQAELAALKLALNTHVHTSSPGGGPTTPNVTPLLGTPTNLTPTESVGRGLIVPGGVPQPIGNEIILQESRIDPNPIVTPPLDVLGD